VLKLFIKTIFISSTLFALLIINVKILSNFQKEWCTFSRKKTFGKNKDCPLLRFECFEHAKIFLIYVKFWIDELCNKWKIFQEILCKLKLLCFCCDLSNIQYLVIVDGIITLFRFLIFG
jgi:hypothetical protein